MDGEGTLGAFEGSDLTVADGGAAGGTAGDLRGDAVCTFGRFNSGLFPTDAVVLRLGRFVPDWPRRGGQ